MDTDEVPHLLHLFICGWAFRLLSYLGSPLQYSCLENPMDGGAW